VIAPAQAHRTSDPRLVLLAGDFGLSSFEDDLSTAWPECLASRPHAFQVMSAFWQVLTDAADAHHADIVLVDVGPSLGAINRAALVASDHVVFPVAPDLFSLQGLWNLGSRRSRESSVIPFCGQVRTTHRLRRTTRTAWLSSSSTAVSCRWLRKRGNRCSR